MNKLFSWFATFLILSIAYHFVSIEVFDSLETKCLKRMDGSASSFDASTYCACLKDTSKDVGLATMVWANISTEKQNKIKERVRLQCTNPNKN